VDHRIDAMQRYLSKIENAPQIDKWKLHKSRTVIGWFSKGVPHGKDIRTGLQGITCVSDVQRLLDEARGRLADVDLSTFVPEAEPECATADTNGF
jgi:hypothetical protein